MTDRCVHVWAGGGGGGGAGGCGTTRRSVSKREDRVQERSVRFGSERIAFAGESLRIDKLHCGVVRFVGKIYPECNTFVCISGGVVIGRFVGSKANDP